MYICNKKITDKSATLPHVFELNGKQTCVQLSLSYEKFN